MLILSLAVITAKAQDKKVGINTSDPKATLHIAEVALGELPAGQAQGVIFPRATSLQRDAYTGVKRGMLLYNSTENCIDNYTLIGANDEWKCLVDVETPTREDVIVEPKGYASWGGSFVAGTPVPNWKPVMFMVKNNTASPINGLNLSNAVTIVNPAGGTVTVDLTNTWSTQNVSIPAGGSYNLQYYLTGTPVKGPLLVQFEFFGTIVDQIIMIN